MGGLSPPQDLVVVLPRVLGATSAHAGLCGRVRVGLKQVAGAWVCNRADVYESWEMGREACSFFFPWSIGLFWGLPGVGRKLVWTLGCPTARPSTARAVRATPPCCLN